MSTQRREILSTFRSGIRSLKGQTVLDQRTKGVLISELKKRLRRNQSRELDEVKDLLKKANAGDTSVIQESLKRCYLQGRYRDHEHIRYFLKANITTWPNESIMLKLSGERNTLESTARTKRASNIRFPEVTKTELPRISNLMKIDEEVECTLEPLPIVPQDEPNEQEVKLNEMLSKVLKLFQFLSSNSFIHPRKLKSPVAVFPVTVFGDDIAACRKKNLIKKKIAYIRNIFMSFPPLEQDDSRYLTAIVDNRFQTREFSRDSYREYKKFLKRTYTIDQDFSISLNKYASIQTDHSKRTDLFEKIDVSAL